MKKENIKELHQKTISELYQFLEKLSQELTQLNIDKSIGQLKDLHNVCKKRKEIAIVKTIIKEKEKK